MSAEYKGCWVVFDHDVHDEDINQIVNAIKMVRHVAGVTTKEVQWEDYMARERVRSDIAGKIMDLVSELRK